MSKKQTYNRIAALYDVLDMPFEQFRYKPLRRVLFEGLSGTLLDAGVGTGRNFPFYPVGSRVTGIDLSPAMLDRARRRKDKLGVRQVRRCCQEPREQRIPVRPQAVFFSDLVSGVVFRQKVLPKGPGVRALKPINSVFFHPLVDRAPESQVQNTQNHY